MNELYLIALVNAGACITAIIIIACRLNAMTGKVRVRWEVKCAHAIGMGAMFCSMLRPFIHEWPGYASLMVDAYILAELWASRHAWHGDRPPESTMQPAPLDTSSLKG